MNSRTEQTINDWAKWYAPRASALSASVDDRFNRRAVGVLQLQARAMTEGVAVPEIIPGRVGARIARGERLERLEAIKRLGLLKALAEALPDEVAALPELRHAGHLAQRNAAT